ncbi:LPXTG-motif cell wall-anchored protein [Sphingomonas kaistensis]|uniref:LPXTG-motif cell wall-anchored protein n=1 Tax=Sphingomonas kaistensis TaxID=298708 RepID=A0A7X5Y6L9_9SPHN|nr:LPXTG cell wall anchor domain-containing protein [Sphingomonas kaistensis]NJC05552.1 LPXTG-motif cell wall-anchored protein [Sphingomonas kaistensis]
MSTSDYLSANNLFILIGVFVIVLVAFLWFLRKPQNRHPMEGEKGRALDEARAQENAQGVTDVPPTRR